MDVIAKKPSLFVPALNPTKGFTIVREGVRARRNDKCPCGSGIKTKYCHKDACILPGEIKAAQAVAAKKIYTRE